MQTEGERIESIIKHFCESKADFARKLGESPQTVNNWTKRGFGKSVMDKIISTFPEINANWLLTGEGNMLKRDQLEQNAVPLKISSGQNELYLQTSAGTKYYDLGNGLYKMRVPLVPYAAYARYANEACGIIEADSEEWSEVDFLVNQIGHGKYVSFEIKGDSMDDESKYGLCHGDKVLAREVDKTYWKSGLKYQKYKFWIIVLESTILVKQIINQNLETGDITCHSLNPSPEYKDFTVNLSDVCKLFNVIQKIPAPYVY